MLQNGHINANFHRESYGGYCMSGSIHLRRDVKNPWWYVVWYDRHSAKNVTISKYTDGSRMYQTHASKKRDFGYNQARKLLSQMQADQERNILRLQRYTGIQRTDIEEFFREWMAEKIEPRRKPGTIKPYWIYLEKWIGPYFREKSIMLHEVDAHVLIKLLNHLSRQGLSPKYVWNIMGALRSMFDYASRVKGLPIPPFPKKEDYGIVRKKPKWMTQEAFWKVIEAVPKIHRPILLWLYYHFRRPGEACVLHKTDYDPVNEAFYIRRTLSARHEVQSTKTGVEHYIPCDSRFKKTARRLLADDNRAPYLFINPRARKEKKDTRWRVCVIFGTRLVMLLMFRECGFISQLSTQAVPTSLNQEGLSMNYKC